MLMRDMIASGLRAVVAAVMAEGMGPEWLGRGLDEAALVDLLELKRTKGVSPSGEGGEYESLVLDSPLHRYRIEVVEAERTMSRDQGRLSVKKAILREKA